MSLGLARCLAHRIVVGARHATNLGAVARDGIDTALAHGLVDEDHTVAAESLRSPGDRAAMIAVGCARDDLGIGWSTGDSISAAECLEAAEAKAACLILQADRSEIGLASRLRQIAEWCDGISIPRGDRCLRLLVLRIRQGCRRMGAIARVREQAERRGSKHGCTVDREDAGCNRGLAAPEVNMRISILGGGGFLGRKIAARLAKDGKLGGAPVTALTLFDLAAPPKPDAGFPVTSVAGDLVELPETAIPPGTDVVFHLAAVVSAQAEADYELGRRVNLRGTDAVVDACRRLAKPSRVVFTSSVASFSGGQDAVVQDDTRQVPSNSYGAQKAAAELILADASRRGFMDAVSIRLPTVIVRAGRPNRAASSFLSAIVREPSAGTAGGFAGADAFAAWVCSPRRAVDWLLHAAGDGHLADGAGPQRQSARYQHDDRASAASAG